MPNAQSPFLGRHEKMDSACPILYPRWTTAGGKETLVSMPPDGRSLDPVHTFLTEPTVGQDAAALAKGKSQKRRRTEDTAEASPGRHKYLLAASTPALPLASGMSC